MLQSEFTAWSEVTACCRVLRSAAVRTMSACDGCPVSGTPAFWDRSRRGVRGGLEDGEVSTLGANDFSFRARAAVSDEARLTLTVFTGIGLIGVSRSAGVEPVEIASMGGAADSGTAVT